jgi:hypothetical protein
MAFLFVLLHDRFGLPWSDPIPTIEARHMIYV